MSESDNTPDIATTAPAPTTNNNKRSGLWLGLLLLVGLLATAGWFGYTQWWPQHQQMQTRMMVDQQQTAATIARLDQQLKTLENRLMQQLNQATVTFEQGVRNQLQHQRQEIESTQLMVQSVQAELANLDLSQESNWRILEAYNLTDRAAMKLWIEHDVVAAISLLKLALSHLAALDNPAHYAVREALTSDIARLEQLPQQQIEAASLALIRLRAQLAEQQWQQSLTAATEGGDSNATAASWVDNLKRSGATLFEQFIQVQRHDQAVAPMLEQAYFNVLQQRTLLQLQLAQQAALQHSQAAYEANLTEAITMLQHVAKQASHTDFSAAIQQLEELRSWQLRPDYPPQLEAQGHLHRLVRQLGQEG